jgi:hypothetical protein
MEHHFAVYSGQHAYTFRKDRCIDHCFYSTREWSAGDQGNQRRSGSGTDTEGTEATSVGGPDLIADITLELS